MRRTNSPKRNSISLGIEVPLREGENGPIERSKQSKGNLGLMGTLEAIFGKALVQFVLSPYVFFNLLFLGRAVVFTALEVLWPARKLSYLPVVWRDLAAYVFFRSVVLPSGLYLNGIVLDYNLIPASVAKLPLVARIAAYFIIADFGHYLVHRLTHTKYFWRVHKWHHSPTYMYWLSGVRSTIPDFFLVNAPYFLAWQFLYISPWWMATGLAVSSILQNDWMHMNVTWRSNWLEWIIVTPRYHHIHHSDDPQFYMKNLGSLFTVWDRLFGTYKPGHGQNGRPFVWHRGKRKSSSCRTRHIRKISPSARPRREGRPLRRAVLMWTRLRRGGQRMLVGSILVLAVCGTRPTGSSYSKA